MAENGSLVQTGSTRIIPETVVCFDLDGVLALTEPLKAKAHTATVGYFGGSATYEQYLQLMGSSHETVRSGMMAVSGINIDEKIYTRKFRQIYHSLVEAELVIRPGAFDLVSQLHTLDIPMAVVSSSTRKMVHQVLEIANLRNLINVVVSADDVIHKKPDPEPYLKAISLLSASPNQAVIFEDSPSGVESGLRAGSKVIAVLHSMNIDQDFSEADYQVDGFEPVPELIDLVLKLPTERKKRHD